ncbi:MAG: NifB/NifX family molybdenum-iron cluster-binding protein [Spirochaetales bacterium]|nr:NifB/NifX family molybdenum-iron cluster-binding protein [Spirochaetales bacterium]
MISGRIAIPSEGQGGLDAQRSGHFGHCSVFTLVDIEEGEIISVDAISNGEHREGGCMVPVNLCAEHKVTALIAAGMGLRPLQGFESVGIDVYFDQQNPDVQSAVEALLAGQLVKMSPDNSCQGH